MLTNNTTKVMDKQIIQEINKMKEAGIQCDVKPGQPLKGANRYKKLYHFTSFNSFVKIWLSKKLLFSSAKNVNDLFENTEMWRLSNANQLPLIAALNEQRWAYKQISLTMDYDSYQKGFMSTSMWGIYGDKNKGISLIYKVNNNKFYIHDEESMKKQEEIEYEIKPVMYGKTYEKINFFKYNYFKFFIEFNNFWYMDSITKKKSKFYFKKAVNDVIELEKSNELYKLYNQHNQVILNNYRKKTKEWVYEKEYRIIVQTKEKIYKYHFQDLHGIIFGIGTPYEAKQKIVKIILDKCKENNRDITDFHFYQAYFNPETNKIEKYEINDISIYTPPTEHNNE